MTRFALILLTCLVSAGVYAQKSEYTVLRGKEHKPSVQWIVDPDGRGGFYLTIINGKQWSKQQIDSKYRTVSWHRVDPDLGNDFTVVRKGENYEITGTVDSKKVNIQSKSNGAPWYQSIAFSAGYVLPKDGTPLKYESVMPKTAKIYPMQAKYGECCTVNGRNAVRIKSGVGGVFAGMWSCFYFIDADTFQFLRYEGVEGVPGTPKTVWTLE